MRIRLNYGDGKNIYLLNNKFSKSKNLYWLDK